jgi:hypothetical protein
MFTPDRTFKKLFHGYTHNCAYVYKDGIAVLEERIVRSGKYEARIEVWHVWRAEIKMYTHGWGWGENDYGQKVKRMVVHDGRELLSGLERVDFYFHNSSEASKRDGISVWTIEFYAPNGMNWSHNCIPQLADNITVQPNPQDNYGMTYSGPDSIEYILQTESVELHN